MAVRWLLGMIIDLPVNVSETYNLAPVSVLAVNDKLCLTSSETKPNALIVSHCVKTALDC